MKSRIISKSLTCISLMFSSHKKRTDSLSFSHFLVLGECLNVILWFLCFSVFLPGNEIYTSDVALCIIYMLLVRWYFSSQKWPVLFENVEPNAVSIRYMRGSNYYYTRALFTCYWFDGISLRKNNPVLFENVEPNAVSIRYLRGSN